MGPCVAGDRDDRSVVPVPRVAIDKTNNATEPLLEGADIVYTLAFAVQNGPITRMVVPDTLSAEVVNPRRVSVAPVSIVGKVISCSAYHPPGIDPTASRPVGTNPGVPETRTGPAKPWGRSRLPVRRTGCRLCDTAGKAHHVDHGDGVPESWDLR